MQITPIIFITAYADVEMAVSALKAGAFDFIEKPYQKDVLLESVIQAMEKDLEASRLHEKSVEAQLRIRKLTKRENNVLELLLNGSTSKEVVQSLGISPRTVDVHRQHILHKFDVNSIAELIRRLSSNKVSFS